MDFSLTDLKSIADIITALANVVMAVGVVFVAGQLIITKRQQSTQLEIHIVELHTHFQQQIREIQKTFSPKVNEDDWMPDEKEKRAIRLYWYLVFDEWFTCKHLSNEKRLNALWERYSWGAISALRNTHFDSEIQDMFTKDTIFLGLGKKFASDIDELRVKVEELPKTKNAVAGHG